MDGRADCVMKGRLLLNENKGGFLNDLNFIPLLRLLYSVDQKQ